MGKIKNVVSKVALGIAGAIGAAAAIGSAAKKTYKTSKEQNMAYANEAAVNNQKKQKVYTSNAKDGQDIYNNAEYLRAQKRRQREQDNKILELSKTPNLNNDGFVGLFLLYLIVGVGFFFLSQFLLNYWNISLDWLLPLNIFFNVLNAYIVILIRTRKYKKRVRTTLVKVQSIKHRLSFLRKEKANNNEGLYADLNGEIVVNQSALNNIAEKYNKYISSFPNIIYTKVFSYYPIVPSETEEEIKVKCVSR